MRTLLHFTLLMGLLLPLTGRGQSFQHDWVRRVGGPADGEKLWRIAVDGYGNVYSAGYFRGTFSDQGQSVTSIGGTDIILLKYDASGNLLWMKNAGGPHNDGSFGVDCDKAGNVYITGVFSGLAVFDTALVAIPDPDGIGLPFHFAARYSPDGDLVWVRTVDVTMALSTYPFSFGYAIKLDRGGDLILAGSYSNINADPNDPAYSTMKADTARFRYCNYNSYDYVFVQKLDTLGNTEWVHSVGGANGFGVLLSIAFDGQSDIWLGGNVSNSNFISGPVNIQPPAGASTCGLVYEISSQGNPLSGYFIPATGFSNVEDLIVAANGEIFIAGWLQNGSLAGAPQSLGYDGFLIRATPQGNIVWADQLSGQGDDFFSGITTTPDPNVIGGGAFYFFQAGFAGTLLSQAAGVNSALILVDTMGNFLEAVQPQLLGGNSKVADVQCDDFGNYYLCGDAQGSVLFTNDTLFCPSQDMYVTRIVPSITTGAIDRPRVVGEVAVYPNPASDRVTIVSAQLQGAIVRIVDATGRLVHSETASASMLTMSLEGLSPGSYMIILEHDGGRVAERLVIARR